jgi:hypothetical protein
VEVETIPLYNLTINLMIFHRLNSGVSLEIVKSSFYVQESRQGVFPFMNGRLNGVYHLRDGQFRGVTLAKSMLLLMHGLPPKGSAFKMPQYQPLERLETETRE